MKSRFCRIEDALEALESGLLTIVVDSEDRENEGDFVGAAEKVTPAMIHFLISEGRGQVCMPITRETAERLELQPMAEGNGGDTPNFTVPVDYAGCKTGISPFERAATIQAILDEQTTAADFVRPGHLFPLVARDGGVLIRQGHTEASIDLVGMARLRPAAVLCEICSADGLHMATRDELFQMSKDLRLPIITIDALVEYRQSEQKQKSGFGMAFNC
jgi:3,4-dihydroxy 2-butanone 4-phosphate synthase/GTP cyclohydrolase II